MSNQCCSIRIFSLFLCLVANIIYINAQQFTPQPQFRSSVISTGFVNTFNGGFNNARSINAGSFLQANVQTNKDQGQRFSTLNDGVKNKPTQPVISFVIPSYASGITHLLDLNGKSPKNPVLSGEILPPISSKLPSNDNEINSRALSPIEPQNSPDFISTTILPSIPFTNNNTYNISNVTPVSLFDKTNIESTPAPVTIRPIKPPTISNFNGLIQTTTFATTSKIEATTSAIPQIFFTTNLSESQNGTINDSQKILSTTNSFGETTTISPESWRRLLILGEQKFPGYAIRSDGSVDPNIGFSYTTDIPTLDVSNFGFENKQITTSTPILLPTTDTTVNTPKTTFIDLNDNPFLPPLPMQSSLINNEFNIQNRVLNKNTSESTTPRAHTLFSTNGEPLKHTNPSNLFAAFKFTVSGFQKSSTLSSIVPNQPTRGPTFAQATTSRTIFTANKTPTTNSAPKRNLNAFSASGLPTNIRSNASATQPSKLQNGFQISQKIPVLNNNPFLPPLAPVIGISKPNSTFENQVSIRNGISLNKNRVATSTEKAKIDSLSSTTDPFAAFKFTLFGFKKNTTFSPLVQNQPMHISLFSQTTNSENIFTTTEITTATSDTSPTKASLLNRFTTNFALNQPPKVQNGIEILKNIPVPDNNPFLPPIAPNTEILTPNSALINQFNNPHNIQTSSSPLNRLDTSTETSITDSYPSTTEPFSNDSRNNQTFEHLATTKAEPVTNFTAIETPLNNLLPPIFPNEDLLPPLSSASPINVIKNETETSSLGASKNNPFLPTLDLNPFLAPFSTNLAQKKSQQTSSTPSIDISTRTENIQSNFPSKFDNTALRNNFFVKPSTQINDFKYTGGFGAPQGILSPYDVKPK